MYVISHKMVFDQTGHEPFLSVEIDFATLFVRVLFCVP